MAWPGLIGAHRLAGIEDADQRALVAFEAIADCLLVDSPVSRGLSQVRG
jgi:hypothetical protein